MEATYRTVMLTKKGSPEVLQVVGLPIELRGLRQLRVHVASVGSTDQSTLTRSYPYVPKVPLIPGYEIARIIDAIGVGVTGFELGQLAENTS